MTNPPKIVPELKDLPHILITDVEPLQGDLKELTVREYQKLKKSLLERGFIFPLFIWKEQNKMLDGHQRQRVYIKEGWLVELPYVPVSAKTEQEAKEKLLLASSQYGKVTQEGWDEFTFDLDTSWIKETVQFDALPFVFGTWDRGNVPDDPNEHWKDMPEFEQDDKSSFKRLIVHFMSQEDVDDFSELVEQSITDKTKYIWYPYQKPEDLTKYRVE